MNLLENMCVTLLCRNEGLLLVDFANATPVAGATVGPPLMHNTLADDICPICRTALRRLLRCRAHVCRVKLLSLPRGCLALPLQSIRTSGAKNSLRKNDRNPLKIHTR